MVDQNHHNDGGLPGRVSSLEASFTSLVGEFHSFRDDIRGALANFTASINEMRGNITLAQRPNYSVMVGGVALVTTIMVSILGFIWMIMQQDRMAVQENTRRMFEMVERSGYERAINEQQDKRLSHLEKLIHERY